MQHFSFHAEKGKRRHEGVKRRISKQMRYAVSKQRTMESGLTVVLSALTGREKRKKREGTITLIRGSECVCVCVCVRKQRAYLRKGKKRWPWSRQAYDDIHV